MPETSKVPEITLGFWIIKIFATTLGEVGGNAVTMPLGLGYLVGSAIFAAVLIVIAIFVIPRRPARHVGHAESA